MAKKEFGQDGIFDTSIPCAEDWDATITMANCARRMGLQETFVEDYLYYYRVHTGNISGSVTSAHASFAKSYILRKHSLGGMTIMADAIASDLPWSLFSWVPEPGKARLRPIKLTVKQVLSRLARPAAIPPHVLGDPLLASYRKDHSRS
jgi:hypothetical protein